MFSIVVNNISYYNLNNRNILRKVTMKIRLKRINIQEEIIIEVLLNSRITELVISSEFIRKQEFKLKKIEKSIYIRNINSSFKKKRPIKHIVEINIYYQEYRERTEINIIKEQK